MSEDGPFIAEGGPSAVGAYPHLRRVGDLIFISGMGPRRPETDEIPGGPIMDKEGNPLDYDIKAQTHSVIDNVRIILEEYGSSLEKVVDVLVFLVDFKDCEIFLDRDSGDKSLIKIIIPSPLLEIVSIAEDNSEPFLSDD